MAIHRELQRRCSLQVGISSIEYSQLVAPLRLVVDCEMKCHMFVVCLEVQHCSKWFNIVQSGLFGFAVAIEDGAYKHWQDGVDEPDERDGKGYAGSIGAEDTEDDKRPSATDGDVSRRYGWENSNNHIIEWYCNKVLHNGHLYPTQV